MIGSMSGAVVGGIQCQHLGRKKSLILDCFVFAVAYIGIGASPNIIILMISRFICGHCCATLLVNIPAYTSEICQPEVRKITGSFVVLAFTSGFSVMLVIGALLQWRITMYIMGAFPAISIIFVWWLVPESPVWLLMRNRKEDARKALMILRGNPVVVDIEINAISANLEMQLGIENGSEKHVEEHKRRWYESVVEIYHIFHDSSFLKPFAILIVIFCIGLEWGGFPAIAFYMVTLLQEADVPMDPYWGAAALGSYRSILLIFSPTITRNFKRRSMYLITCGMVVLGDLGIATYYFLKTETNLVQAVPILKWTPIISVVIVYTGFSFGYGTVPYIQQGEILPAQSRSLGSGLLGLMDNIILFVATKTALTIAEAVGTSGAFYLYAGCALFSGVVAYFRMPETLGLSLEQIESMYRGNNKIKDESVKNRHRTSRSQSVVSFYDTVSQYGR